MTHHQPISLADAVGFIDHLHRNELITGSYASRHRTALRAFIRSLPDHRATTPLTIHDTATACTDFATSNADTFSAHTIRKYCCQVRRVMYLKMIHDTAPGCLADATRASNCRTIYDPITAQANTAPTDMIDISLNLRRGMNVTMRLPEDLTPSEARRIATWVANLPKMKET